MTHLSKRIRAITGGDDDGWGVHYRAMAMKRAGDDVTILSVGDHDFTTAQTIVDACKASLDAGHHHYSAVTGPAELRQAVAQRVQDRTGVDTTIDQTIIAPGGQACLFACAALALDPGDEAIIIDPYYATYVQTICAAGGVAVPVPALAEDGFQPRQETIEAAITPKTRMILINSPNNPSGAVYSRESLEGIAGLCREHELWLVSDEVYETQVYDSHHISPRTLEGMKERTLVIGSMSKSHAMTGWRVGWVVGPEDAVAGIADLFLTTTYGMPPFIQDAALVGLRDGVDGEREIAALYRRRRDVAIEALSGSNRLSVFPAAAAMYLLVDVRALTDNGEDFANALLDAEEIGVMPGESFGESASGHFRLSLCTEDGKLAEACRRIAAFADNWSPT